jgi:hypothetical protein
VQATPRDARIDVEDVCHVVATIGPSTAPCIATKDRTSPQDAGKGSRWSPRRLCDEARALFQQGC